MKATRRHAMLPPADPAATTLALRKRVMKNDCIHSDPLVHEARKAVADLLLACRIQHARNPALPVPADAAIEHLADLLASRPAYASRRGHYQPFGLRHGSR